MTDAKANAPSAPLHDPSHITPAGGWSFAKGNPGGPGNPNTKQVAIFRESLYACVTSEDFTAIVRELITNAREGKPWAVKEFLDRILGKAHQSIGVEGLPEILRRVILLEDEPKQPEAGSGSGS
jgi:hypothetical protein